jgi:hypothetical protein
MMKSALFLIQFAIALALVPVSGLAYGGHQICIRYNVQTIDSGEADYSGRSESYWTGADRSSPNHYYVTARGPRVSVYDPFGGAVEQFFWGDPSTGCFNYTSLSPQPVVRVRVFSRARDANGNIIRIHDAGGDSSSSRPGGLYYQQIDNVVLWGQNQVTVDVDGRSSGNTKWTVMAIAAYTLYRFRYGNYNKEISIGFLDYDDDCWSSSSSFGSSTSYVTSGRHLVRLSTCSMTQHLRKFLVSHEIGHALARLYYGRNGGDSPKNTCYEEEDDCSYSMASAEWDSVSFPEGFAHFVSTRTWNDKQDFATINWFGTPYQAEYYDFNNYSGGSYLKGGDIVNAAGIAEHGVTTNADWLRFYWDFYTSTTCGEAPDRQDMLRLYRQVRENRYDGVYEPTDSSFHWAVHIALADIPEYSQCERDNARSFLDWNATGGTYHGW